MSVRFTVPLVPPSGNELRRKYRHWAVYKGLRELWEVEIFLHISPEASSFYRARTRSMNPRKPELTKISIAVFRGKLLDDDNLKSGVKPVLDGLKNMGYIKNDSPRWIVLEVSQHRDAANPRTEISVEAV